MSNGLSPQSPIRELADEMTTSDGRYSRYKCFNGDGGANGAVVETGFLANVFALNMSMQRHPNTSHTHTHTHTDTHPYVCSHTRSTVKHLFDKATLETLDSYPYLPAQPQVAGPHCWFSVTFVYFILFARVN